MYLDFLGFSICTPLDNFSWSQYKSLYLDFLGFRFAPPPPWPFFLKPLYKFIPAVSGGVNRISICIPLNHFSWSHYKSLYLDLFRISNCTPFDHFSWSHYKSLYLDFLGFRFAPPPMIIFPEVTIKVYIPRFFRISIFTPPPLDHFS